ncbi:MAG: hypothetical protein LBB38_03390 [Puniceicoccales bacterium]|nr:hypothetical protein [Puniceicoccales bacterium]
MKTPGLCARFCEALKEFFARFFQGYDATTDDQRDGKIMDFTDRINAAANFDELADICGMSTGDLERICMVVRENMDSDLSSALGDAGRQIREAKFAEILSTIGRDPVAGLVELFEFLRLENEPVILNPHIKTGNPVEKTPAQIIAGTCEKDRGFGFLTDRIKSARSLEELNRVIAGFSGTFEAGGFNLMCLPGEMCEGENLELLKQGIFRALSHFARRAFDLPRR